MKPAYVIEIYKTQDKGHPAKNEISRVPGEPMVIVCPNPDALVDEFHEGLRTYLGFPDPVKIAEALSKAVEGKK